MQAVSSDHAAPLWLPGPSFLPLRTGQEPDPAAATSSLQGGDGVTAAPLSSETAEQVTSGHQYEFYN